MRLPIYVNARELRPTLVRLRGIDSLRSQHIATMPVRPRALNLNVVRSVIGELSIPAIDSSE